MERAVNISAVPSHTGGMYVMVTVQTFDANDEITVADRPLNGVTLPLSMICGEAELPMFANRVVRTILRALEDRLWEVLHSPSPELKVVRNED